MSVKITAQKEAFAKDLEVTTTEIAKSRNLIEQLTIKENQLRGAIYALELALHSLSTDAQPVEVAPDYAPLEEATAQAQAAVDASVEA